MCFRASNLKFLALLVWCSLASSAFAEHYVVFLDHYAKTDTDISNLYLGQLPEMPSQGIYPLVPRKLNVPAPYQGHFGNPDVTCDGKRIVFPVRANNDWNIYMGDLNAKTATITNVIPVSVGQDTDEDPKFSFDGQQIVYKKKASPTSRGLGVYDVAAKDSRSILMGPPELYAPAWHRVGSRIVYTQRSAVKTGVAENMGDDILTVDWSRTSRKTTTTPVALVASPLPDWYPTYLHGGGVIFVQDRTLHLWSSKGVTALKQITAGDFDPYAYKDDKTSRYIAFVGIRPGADGNIHDLYIYDRAKTKDPALKIDMPVKDVLGPVVFGACPTP